MIARVWRGTVPLEKADEYGKYLSDSDRGVRDYQKVQGNRGVTLMRRTQGNRVQFLLISLWESRESIARYAGEDIDRAQYFSFDRECLLDPEPEVAHYDVITTTESGAA